MRIVIMLLVCWLGFQMGTVLHGVSRGHLSPVLVPLIVVPNVVLALLVVWRTT